MTKKITELTEAQKAKFPEYVEKWTKIGLSTEPANRAKAEEGIKLAYKLAGKKPPLIVWCGSPLSNALTREVIKKISPEDFKKLAGEKVRDSVGASVGASVWASVWDSVGDSVRDSVWDSVGDSVRDSVGDSVWDSVWDSVGDSVRDSVGDSGYGQHDANFSAYVQYFRDELGLKEQTEKWEGNRVISENAGWYLPHENICWVSERHNIVKTDDRGRLHCEDGPALQYPDGWGLFYWHGTKVPEGWILNKSTLKASDAIKWPNIEQRRCACEILGWAKILQELDAKVIDKDDDPEIGELLEVNIPDIGKEKFLRVQCGTKRVFAMPVPPEMKTALQSNAWTYGIDDWKSYKPEIRT